MVNCHVLSAWHVQTVYVHVVLYNRTVHISHIVVLSPKKLNLEYQFEILFVLGFGQTR